MNIDELKALFQYRTPTILGSENLAKFSLLLPLVQKKDGLHLLFEVRSPLMRRQPGEICFPGGKIDPEDKTPECAAIRETCEEIGVPPESVRLLFPLDFMLSPFGTLIYSYAGILDLSKVNLNEAEVAEVFTVPLDFLLKTSPEIHHVQLRPEPGETFPFHLIANGKEYNWQTKSMEEFFYFYENRIIWGLTARVLKHFLDMIRQHPQALDK